MDKAMNVSKLTYSLINRNQFVVRNLVTFLNQIALTLNTLSWIFAKICVLSLTITVHKLTEKEITNVLNVIQGLYLKIIYAIVVKIYSILNALNAPMIIPINHALSVWISTFL